VEWIELECEGIAGRRGLVGWVGLGGGSVGSGGAAVEVKLKVR